MLQRQSEWFLSVRVTAVYFLLWKQRLAASVEEREKSGVALWHWSLALQRKVGRKISQAWRCGFKLKSGTAEKGRQENQPGVALWH